MIVVGALLLILGLALNLGVLTILGIVLLIVGLLFGGLGYAGRPVMGRRYWY